MIPCNGCGAFPKRTPCEFCGHSRKGAAAKSRVKAPTKMEESAKLRKRWLSENREITSKGRCEICSGTFGVAQAHRMKRRKMPPWKKEREAWEAEMMMAAYLCTKCHLELEQGDPQVMFDRVTEIIEGRRK